MTEMPIKAKQSKGMEKEEDGNDNKGKAMNK